MIKCRNAIYKSSELQNGYNGKSVHFEHREFEERSQVSQEAYLRLQDDLLANGINDPLITYQGHVLIGMRRFEIMRDRIPEFHCVEITENITNWTINDVRRLNDFKHELYGNSFNEFVG